MDSTTLAHYGIIGMKWGVRRYQNKDGSLTFAGKMRAKRLQSAIDANDRDVADLKKHGYVSEAKAVKAVGDRNREKLAAMRESAAKKSVKDMSDAELRNRLNRLQMEKQYSQLTSADTNKGKEFVSKTLKVATGVATATTTALTIYNNYSKIKSIVDGMMKAKKAVN